MMNNTLPFAMIYQGEIYVSNLQKIGICSVEIFQRFIFPIPRIPISICQLAGKERRL